jgi:quinol monooxygenase YgiN
VQVPHRPDAVTLVEKWESMEHLTAHMTASHMTTYRQRVKPFVIRLSLQVLEPVS